ncbi:neutral zinc metallopeptidase [Streptomyces sp. NPDC060031]|uniref:neutral zinc metallopeptidase n=1 Tax=Streptomyces sp. NPDC060031 TaxID=3347043 RepID=UPI00367BEEA4
MRRYVRTLFSTTLLVCVSLGGVSLGATNAPSRPVSKPGWSMRIDPKLTEETSDAVQVVNGFWDKNWSDFFTESYRPPSIYGTLGFYDTESVNFPRCSGETPDKYNALYCLDGDYLAWSVHLMDMGFNMVGDSWVYLVVAHEWGHAIQARLNSDLQFVSKELQADCLAGATLQGATRDGTLRWEKGDTDEIINGLQKLGDTTAWANPKDHGDISQRTKYFTHGVSGGVNACLPQQEAN